MSYPTITEYKDAIQIAESFDKLKPITPVRNSTGTDVYFSTGNFAVVFKMHHNKEVVAIKCFTREQSKRKERLSKISTYLKNLDKPYLLNYEYLENEIWVKEPTYPVLKMKWVEGETLEQKVTNLCNRGDKQTLALLANNFRQLAMDLLSMDFAHGDLKPDNILVTPTNNLVLVDYDGMYIPAFKGEEAEEMGEASYQHPKRTAQHYDKSIDDFSILVLYLNLLALSKEPSFLKQFHSAGTHLLLSKNDYDTFLLNRRPTVWNALKSLQDQKIDTLLAALEKSLKSPLIAISELNALLSPMPQIDSFYVSAKSDKELHFSWTISGNSLGKLVLSGGFGKIDVTEKRDCQTLRTGAETCTLEAFNEDGKCVLKKVQVYAAPVIVDFKLIPSTSKKVLHLHWQVQHAQRILLNGQQVEGNSLDIPFPKESRCFTLEVEGKTPGDTCQRQECIEKKVGIALPEWLTWKKGTAALLAIVALVLVVKTVSFFTNTPTDTKQEPPITQAEPQKLDSDGDGVLDTEDICPKEKGPESNNGCPVRTNPTPTDSDSDGDGVPDGRDRCPYEKGGESNNGCPVQTNPTPTDSDGDGVPDGKDRCPYEKGQYSNNGCPEVSSPKGGGGTTKTMLPPSVSHIETVLKGVRAYTSDAEIADIIKTYFESDRVLVISNKGIPEGIKDFLEGLTLEDVYTFDVVDIKTNAIGKINQLKIVEK